MAHIPEREAVASILEHFAQRKPVAAQSLVVENSMRAGSKSELEDSKRAGNKLEGSTESTAPDLVQGRKGPSPSRHHAPHRGRHHANHHHDHLPLPVSPRQSQLAVLQFLPGSEFWLS